MLKPYLLSGLVLCAVPSLAAASPSYPAAIASELGLPCEPACTVCHTRATGGFATVNTPLGLTVRMDYDLACCDPAGLGDVLEALREAETDSDGDGTTDVAELEALTDPNTEDDEDLACTAPAEQDSGCAVRGPGASRRQSGSALVVAGVFVVMAAAVRRRRVA